MANDLTFDSFFSKKIVDNNGISVTDINAGLTNLYEFFNDNAHSFTSSQKYLVSNHEEDYPELVALHSTLNSEQYWWWILFLNRLDDSLVDIKENWLYDIYSSNQINSFIEKSNTTDNSETSDRLGKIVDLN